MVAKRGAVPTSELVDSLVQLTFTIHAVLTRVAAAHDVSVTQLRLLGILRDRTPAMTALAEHLGLDRSSVTGLVDRAAQRGLVARTTSPIDARVTTVGITPQGRRVIRQIGDTVSNEIESLVGHIPSRERDCVVRLAQSVLETHAVL
jgi:DNA-binding MarR family transcriptional regulator